MSTRSIKPSNAEASTSTGKASTTAPSFQRKRSSSKSHSNYNPMSNNSALNGSPSSHMTSIDELPNEAKPPALQQFVHVVKLLSPDQTPSEFIKILSVPLAPDALRIGRQNVPKVTNKITDGFFDSRVLSRNHAELFIKNNTLYIKDLKSSNGTFINDEKLEPHKEYELHIGDKLDLGTTLESQLAHKKITCKVAEFNYVSLSDYENLVTQTLNKGSVEFKKLELFNSSLDALIFSDVIEEQEDLVLQTLLDDLAALEDTTGGEYSEGYVPESNKSQSNDNDSNDKIVTNLSVKATANMEDVIRKLIISINNEYIQQQKLKEISRFLKKYIKYTPESIQNYNFKELESQIKQQNQSDTNDKIKKWQLKVEKAGERNKTLEAELNLVREHLATARTNENKSKLIKEENDVSLIKIIDLKKKLEMKDQILSSTTEELEVERKINDTLKQELEESKLYQEKLIVELEEYKAKVSETSEMLTSLKYQQEPTGSDDKDKLEASSVEVSTKDITSPPIILEKKNANPEPVALLSKSIGNVVLPDSIQDDVQRMQSKEKIVEKFKDVVDREVDATEPIIRDNNVPTENKSKNVNTASTRSISSLNSYTVQLSAFFMVLAFIYILYLYFPPRYVPNVYKLSIGI